MPDGCRRIMSLPSIGCSWPYRAKTALCLTTVASSRWAYGVDVLAA